MYMYTKISDVRGYVVFETLHDFYWTAIIKKESATLLMKLALRI